MEHFRNVRHPESRNRKSQKREQRKWKGKENFFISEEIKETSLNWRACVSRIKRTTEWSTKTRPTSSLPWSSIKMNKYIWLFTTLDNRQSRNMIPNRRGNSARAELKFTSFLSGDTSPTIVQRGGGTFIYHWTEADMEVWNCWQVLEEWLSTHKVRTWNAQLRADCSRHKLYRGSWSPTMLGDIQIWN